MNNGDLVLVTHYFEDRKQQQEFVSILKSDADAFGLVTVKDPFSPGDLKVSQDNVELISKEQAAEILGW